MEKHNHTEKFPAKRICYLNWKYFFLILIFLVISMMVVQRAPPKKLELKFSNNNFRQYIFVKKPQNQFSMIISEALGSTLNLSWYDVCFYNRSIVTQRGVTTTPVTLEADIFPFNTNKYMLDLQKGLEILPPLNNEQSETIERVISGERIVAQPGLGECPLHIPASEGGFEYSLFLLATSTDQYGTPIVIPVSLPNIGTINPYPLDEGLITESRQLSLEDTTLQVQTNFYALWIKRVVFIFLALGLFESIKKIVKTVFLTKES